MEEITYKCDGQKSTTTTTQGRKDKAPTFLWGWGTGQSDLLETLGLDPKSNND